MSSRRLLTAVSLALSVFAFLPGFGHPNALWGSAPAHAGNGNGNGHGNGDGHGNGNGNGNGNSNSHGNGAVASNLGALNAAHASTMAFAKASNFSEVGKIRGYIAARANAQTAADALAAAIAAAAAHPSDPTLADAVTQAEAALKAAQDAQAAALAAAANKAVTPETQAELNALYDGRH